MGNYQSCQNKNYAKNVKSSPTLKSKKMTEIFTVTQNNAKYNTRSFY